ncbi:MAG: hypothetical protein AAF456_11200 [Planctomycetota bacterium]
MSFSFSKHASTLLLLMATLWLSLFPGPAAYGQVTTESNGSETSGPAAQSSSLEPRGIAGASDDGVADNDARLEARVDELLRELNSPRFSDRQVAAEQLWRLGPEVTKILENRIAFVEPESAARIKSILAAFKLGIDADTPRSTALMVLYFHDGEANVREQILYNLYRQGRYTVLLDLISSLDTYELRRQFYSDVIELDETIASLAMRGEWAEMEILLEHPLCLEFDLPLCAFHARTQGRFKKLLDELRLRVDRQTIRLRPPVAPDGVDESADNARQPDATEDESSREYEIASWQRDLINLIKLLRFDGQREAALEYAQDITEDRSRYSVIRQLNADMGRWDLIAASCVIRDAGVAPAPDQIAVSAVQKALAHYFAGQKDEYESILQDLLDQARNEEEGQQEFSSHSSPKVAVLNLLFATLQLERAEELFDEFKFEQQYELYSWLQDHDRGFQAIGMEPPSVAGSIDQRVDWYDRKVRQIDSILKQYERTGRDYFNERAESLFARCATAASRLGTLGHREEALLHLRTLLNGIDNESSVERRNVIVSALVRLGFKDEVWRILEDHYKPVDYAYVAQPLFQRNQAHAMYWNSLLKPHCKDDLTRMKLIARLCNSPLKIENEPINPSSILNLFPDYQSWPASQLSEFYFRYACLWLMHGDREKYALFLERSGLNDKAQSTISRARLLWFNGQYRRSAALFDAQWQNSEDQLMVTWAAESLALAGDADGAARRRTAQFAFWLESYRKTRTMDSFREADRGSWLLDAMNMSMCAELDTNSSQYRKLIAETIWLEDPRIAVNHLNLVLFNEAAEAGEFPTLELLETARQRCIANGLALVDEGRIAGGVNQFESCLAFRPGDPGFGEHVLPALDARGETEIADRLFDLLAGHYANVLSQYPDSSTGHNNYAWICACSGRRKPFVLYHAELAASLEPGNPGYRDTLAEALFATGDVEGAAAASAACLGDDTSSLNYLRQFYRFGGSIPFEQTR